jgi:hypothetical protein
MKQKETRQKEAKERQIDYKSMTPAQKIIALDVRLGVNVGAKKQRAKLLNNVAKNAVEIYPKTMEKLEDKKPYQKSKRS